MKKIVFLATFLMANLFFTSCDTNDNTFYNDVFVTSPNLVRIEASLAGYNVNDTIYVNCYIDRLLNVPGQTNLLDVRQSTGYANNFNFTYLLERQINTDEWEVVDVNPSAIDVTAGRIIGGNFYYASAAFSPSSDGYEFRAGIPLLVAGNYRISFGYNSTSTQIIELRSESINNNIFVNIISNEGNNLLNSAGYYTFTVL
jgi:hypothetical protein